MFIHALRLHNFRNYTQLTLEGMAKTVVLFGTNGAGKTNVLEAISLLSAGRGLKGAKLSSLQRGDTEQPASPHSPLSSANTAPWVVSADITGLQDTCQLATGGDSALAAANTNTDKDSDTDDSEDSGTSRSKSEKRIFRIDQKPIRSARDFADYVRVLWLIPRMDRTLAEGTTARRSFLDTLTAHLYPDHNEYLNTYERVMRERSQLLKQRRDLAHPHWIDVLEKAMARTGIAIAAARVDYINRLTGQLESGLEAFLEKRGLKITEWYTHFPRPDLECIGLLESSLIHQTSLTLEESFCNTLRDSRERDRIVGGASCGTHRSDLSVTHRQKGLTAEDCSTGEQKALLLGIMMAHCALLTTELGEGPILLLDEVVAHLDENRRTLLLQALECLDGQVWLTGVDWQSFASLSDKAAFFEVSDATVKPFMRPNITQNVELDSEETAVKTLQGINNNKLLSEVYASAKAAVA